MICKKCGREYADDMFKCLWCDAPNEHHVPPEVPETVDFSEVLDVQQRVDDIILSKMPENVRDLDEEGEEKVAKHPAGNFMWCAAILATSSGSMFLVPFYIAFFHRGELRKNGLTFKFTSIYIAAIGCLRALIQILDPKKILDLLPLHEDFAAKVQSISFVAEGLIYLVLCGYASAFILKRLLPDYNADEYKKVSRKATLLAVPTVLFVSTIIELILRY